MRRDRKSTRLNSSHTPTSRIRSVMNYASPRFSTPYHFYLKKDLENVEKRALSIICPGLAYRKALELSNIMSINGYIASLCKKTFLSMTRPIAYITYFNPQGRRVIICGVKGLSRFPNVRPSVLKIVF